MALSGCFSRSLLCSFGFLFLTATIPTWWMSGRVMSACNQISSFSVSDLIWTSCVFMISVGFACLLAGIIACVASFRGNRERSMIVFMLVFLTLIALLAATTALVFAGKSRVHSLVGQEVNMTISMYGEPGHEALTQQMDFIQSSVNRESLFCWRTIHSSLFS